MRTVTRTALTLVGLFAISALPAMAQGFKAEVSCNGIFAPGAVVPVVADVENKGVQPVTLDVNVQVQVPGLGDLPWRTKSLTVGPDQHRVANLKLNLPLGAPNGSYTVKITASSPGEMSFDTCSFSVQ